MALPTLPPPARSQAQPEAPVPTDAAEAPARTQPHVVAVLDLETERAGRVFPCLQPHAQYTGCIGYDACQVLCWSPRPRDREALVRVETSIEDVPCRECLYAREVRGAVAVLHGRQVPLMECRLGFWHGRTTVHDFTLNKIALNVPLPCPGWREAASVSPAIERVREVARRRRGGVATEEQTMSAERLELEADLKRWSEAAPGNARRVENRRRLREFLRVTPREEAENRLTLLATAEGTPALVVTRAQLTAALEQLRPQVYKILVLTMEQRRTRLEVQDALHGISERTLERAQAAGLDMIIEWVTAET